MVNLKHIMSEQTELDQWKPPGGDVAAYTPPVPDVARTPAQARVEAVSTLLHGAYQRASTLVLTPEQDQALSEDFPDEAFKPGASGKEHLIYIEHAFLRDRFNSVFGRGQWAMVRTRPHWAEEFRTGKGTMATRIYAEAALLVKGCYVGESIGEMVYYPNNESQNYGDAAEGAMTAAFRRCAKNFGVGLQAHKKDFAEGWRQRQRQGASTAQRPPQTTAPAATQSRSTATASIGAATAKTREWMLAKLSASFSLLDIQNWAVKHGVITAGAVMATDWPLDKVPTTGSGIRDLAMKIQEWIATQSTPEQQGVEEEPPIQEGPGDEMTQSFWDVGITVPRAGMRGEAVKQYRASPDTIRTLYNAMKDGDEPSRTRLWGLAKGWTPQPWVGADGATRQPGAADIAARTALDEFLAWHDGKGEQ